MTTGRTPVPGLDVDEVLAQMNDALSSVADDLLEDRADPPHPTLFVVGAPRSGTTILVQTLARRYELGYITNLAARFWKAPSLGCVLSEAIRGDRPPETGGSSQGGSTPGYEGPHEFGFFWRRWFDYGATHRVSDDALKKVPTHELRREIAGIQRVYERPLLLKNPVLSLYVDFLAKAMPGSLFIDCRRDPFFVAQSLLRCRERLCDTKEDWYSIRPPAYPTLKEEPYPEQIAGQIAGIRETVDRSLASLSRDRWIPVRYEAFCQDPEPVLDACQGLVHDAGGTLPKRDIEPPELSNRNTIRVDDDEKDALTDALERYGLHARR